MLTMKRRRLQDFNHPFHEYPFEALSCDSWQSVKLIEIRQGTGYIHFADVHYGIEKKSPSSDIRLKSREATLSDCTCFLRPGIDVCVLSSPQQTEAEDEENSVPVWLDAKISSIERKPHDSQCVCRFFVNIYVHQGHGGWERGTLNKQTREVGIDQISILQKLVKEPCEDQFYRWDSSEDCPAVQRAKIFLGKFSSDFTWLLLTSNLKQVSFDVRSVQNKIIYQINDGDYEDHWSLKFDNHQSSVNFGVDNGVLTPTIFQFAPDDTQKEASISDTHGEDSSPKLRRSKRRNVQPERYIGCDLPQFDTNNWVRSRPYIPEKWREEELYLPLSFLLGEQTSPQDQIEDVKRVRFHVREPLGNKPVEMNKAKLGTSTKSELQTPLSKIREKKSKLTEFESRTANKSERQTSLAIVPLPSDSDLTPFDQFNFTAKAPKNFAEEFKEVMYSYRSSNASSAAKRKKDLEFDDMVLDSRWAGLSAKRKGQSARYRPLHSRRNDPSEPKKYKKTALSAGAYNKLINFYMKNIESTISSKEEPKIIDQWKQFKAKNNVEQKGFEPSAVEDAGEMSEIEMLWMEMELCMTSAYLMEEDEARVAAQTTQPELCEHEFKLDEEVGISCKICGFIKTEIKYVSAPFREHVGWTAEEMQVNAEDIELKTDGDDGLNLFKIYTSCENAPLTEKNDNVWALIPDIRKKLHLHQKKAFEFLWRNIAGSLIPTRMKRASKKIGGCVVSHTPGAGKTFLIIAFLVSYLKLFPGKRPLVLAPKTTLYTWYKEFIKWEIPIPVHLIHGNQGYRAFRQTTMRNRDGPRLTSDVMHILDCLEKLQKWHVQPSVLVMGYTSFLTLMREDAKFAHRRYMAKVLRESPGLLILDEGHNPRSTKSRLRKVLMKVETDQRILLSGTLFQNNFCEYFNTLCLARPKFIREVLKELDPKFKKKKGMDKARHLLESRARKFFLDHIARKIDSNLPEERMQGLNMLRNMTNRFIDVYEGGPSDNLPGLQIYTILMNSTEIQHGVLTKLRRIMSTYNGYPLELELLITLASIHPSLVKTSNCVHKFFDYEELMQLERIKYDFKKGSKVMFVLNLVYRIVRSEKVLIFCHNIAPINLFLGLFECVFKWQRGREILVLTGDQELFERGKVMDKFEEPGGPSKVLLASITACAEGISLTAASRVVLLDSEWNPSKTKQAIARAFRPGQQKMVYVYQLLATGTLEEDKYKRTTWKEWVSRMIFCEEVVEDPSQWQDQKIEDEVLREMVEDDRVKSFHMIMKNEKASTRT